MRTGDGKPCPTRSTFVRGALAAATLITLFSCAHPMVSRTSGAGGGTSEGGTASGGTGAGSSAPPLFPNSPALPSRSPGVELYFGSGMATGFAYQGALKALGEWKVKIVRIHAREVGALVAVAYANAGGNPNRMDWTLTKFPENSFTNKTSGLLFSKLESAESRLDKRLGETFGATKESDLPIPVLIDGVADGTLSLWEKIRVSMTHPPILGAYKDMKPSESNVNYGDAAESAANRIVVIEARSEAETKVVETRAGKLLVIQLGIPHFPDDDFKRRSQAAYYGRNQLEKLKKEVQAFLRAEDLR